MFRSNSSHIRLGLDQNLTIQLPTARPVNLTLVIVHKSYRRMEIILCFQILAKSYWGQMMSDTNRIDSYMISVYNKSMYDSFYGNNHRSNKDRPNPTVRPVIRSEEQLKHLQNILSNPRISQSVKKRFMSEKAGGYCSVCGGVATQIASYDMVDATLVEKYCDTCLAREIS